MRVVRFIAVLALPLVGCGLAGGCGRQSPPGSAPPTPVTTPPRADRGIEERVDSVFEGKWNAFRESDHDRGDLVIVGELADADSLSPLTARFQTGLQIMALIFDGLTKIYPDFSRGPSLAESWKFSPDRKELTFHLRKDVRWHDGAPFTARDVEFTFRVHKDTDLRQHFGSYKRDIQDCVVIDDHTVKFIFSKTSPYQLMDASVGFPVPQHILGKVPVKEIMTHKFHREPVGTGPFRLVRWKPNEYIRVAANLEYYGGRPAVDGVIFKVVPEIENRVLQLKNEDIDVLTHVPRQHFTALLSAPHLKPHVVSSRRYYYIGWNLKNSLFQSKRVRQALTMAIDREDLVKRLFGKYAEVCRGPVSPLLWGHNPHLSDFPFDPERARRLLAEEGWKDGDGDGYLDKNGKRFSFTLLANTGNKVKKDTVALVQGMLRRVGVEVKQEIVPGGSFKDKFFGGAFDAIVGGWSVAVKMDMTTIWHSKSTRHNVFSYSNPEVDRLCDQASRELDREKARKLWWKAQEIIVEDQPYTFLYLPKQLNLVHARFRNVQMEALDWIYNIEQWWVPEGQQRRSQKGQEEER